MPDVIQDRPHRFYDRPTRSGLIMGDDQTTTKLYVVRGGDARGAMSRVGERVAFEPPTVTDGKRAGVRLVTRVLASVGREAASGGLSRQTSRLFSRHASRSAAARAARDRVSHGAATRPAQIANRSQCVFFSSFV
jgi:hypothetical protein